MAKFQSIIVQVRNVSNDHCHFKREIDLPVGMSFDYNNTTQVLLNLFPRLDVYVTFDIKLYEHKDLR